MLVIVLDPLGADLEVEHSVLSSHGHSLERLSDDPQRRRRQLAAAAAVLATDGRIDGELLDAMPGCRVAATYGVGYDNIDIGAARERGVAVTNVPDCCTEEVADHTVALILALLRDVVRGDRLMRDGGWGIEPFKELRRIRGQTLGLLGMGRIGRAVASRAQGFGFRVIGHDPWLSGAAPSGVDLVGFPELLGWSDVLSLHLPITPNTQGIVDASAIERMRPGAVVVNTSRGGLLDLRAALDALDTRHLGGIGLDVFPDEPPERGRLVYDGDRSARDGLVMTPHIAFYSVEALEESRRSAAETIAAVLAGAAVPNRIA